MPFKDQSSSFTNGFECGQIWEKIQAGENIENYLCHYVNKDQIVEIAKTFGCDALFVDLDETWSEVTVKSFEF